MEDEHIVENLQLEIKPVIQELPLTEEEQNVVQNDAIALSSEKASKPKVKSAAADSALAATATSNCDNRPILQAIQHLTQENMEFGSGSLDDGSGSAPPDSVRQSRRQLPQEPYLQKRARNQLEAEDAELVPVAAMARLQLRNSRRSQLLNLNPLPTWGQIKKLTIEGQRLVLQAGKPLNPENLFLALCTLLTVASGTEVPQHSYWAYISNPPLLEPVKWGTSDILLYTTPREILSALWADLTPHNQGDGTLFNFTYYGNQRPICIGEPPCIPLGWQYWIQHGIKAGSKRTRLQALAAQTFIM
ncbi:interferon-activable protein 208-like [Cavia porcellus]|uniref:interferon-activable protein 208-like n=1 Tax=Cavia porcellus TaxID=10141 RepID=UPI002FDF336F